MDTRGKILRLEEMAGLREQCARLKVVTGYFDPLLAAHARRLAELRQPGEKLVVVITDPPDPILPARARAELVAALAAVDAVVVGLDVAEALEVLRPDEVFQEEAADEKRRHDLAQLIACRYKLAP